MTVRVLSDDLEAPGAAAHRDRLRELDVLDVVFDADRYVVIRDEPDNGESGYFAAGDEYRTLQEAIDAARAELG